FRTHCVLSPYFFLLMTLPPPSSTLFPYTTLFRSDADASGRVLEHLQSHRNQRAELRKPAVHANDGSDHGYDDRRIRIHQPGCCRDRKSTRLNSSHVSISYAVFCLKKKKIQQESFA